jgi:hypothetical protein
MAKNDSNDSKENVVELWGHEFNLTKNGLDEAQVASFVNELINERDLLIQRVEHFSTLTKLAEKTIIEADNLAEEIKKEAIEEAKAEAKAIAAKADEQAKAMIEEKRTEIVNIATEEAEAIKANAEREAELLIEQQKGRIHPEIKDMAQRLYRELLSQLESLKQQVTASEIELEHKLSQPLEQVSTVKIEEEPPPTQAPVDIPQESSTLSAETSPENMEEVPVESQQSDQAEEKTPPSVDSQEKSTHEKEVELEILPPLDIKQIMGIMRYLDSVTEVENTELIPLTDRPLIVVSLSGPVRLIELLGKLPEVDKVKEVTDEEATPTNGDAPAEGKRRKIQITLSGNSALDDAKETMNSEVYHTLSS